MRSDPRLATRPTLTLPDPLGTLPYAVGWTLGDEPAASCVSDQRGCCNLAREVGFCGCKKRAPTGIGAVTRTGQSGRAEGGARRAVASAWILKLAEKNGMKTSVQAAAATVVVVLLARRSGS